MAEQANGQEPEPLTRTEVINLAVEEAHRAVGFLLPNGKLDHQKRAAAALEVAKRRGFAKAPGERKDVSTPVADVAHALFPEVPSEQDEFDAQPDPELADAIHDRIVKHVRTDLKIDKSGRVQKMLANGGDNGDGPMVLCRWGMGTSKVDSVYLTVDWHSILADNSRVMKEAIKREALKHVGNLEEWMDRLPDDAERFAKDYKKGMNAAIREGQTMIDAAVERIMLERGETEENGDEPGSESGSEG